MNSLNLSGPAVGQLARPRKGLAAQCFGGEYKTMGIETVTIIAGALMLIGALGLAGKQ